jgi:preprotein translocase subunit YajC
METKGYLELSELYSSIYNDVSESHYKVGDKVLSKSGGMKGEVVKVDSEEKGKYYTVKHSDGKTAKYAPDELEKK